MKIKCLECGKVKQKARNGKFCCDACYKKAYDKKKRQTKLTKYKFLFDKEGNLVVKNGVALRDLKKDEELYSYGYSFELKGGILINGTKTM
jgi:hypothetical protein